MADGITKDSFPRHAYEGRVAVVLGASAEGGSGWRIAEALAEAGAHVIVAARSINGIERLADKIKGTAMRCDASCFADVAALAQAAADCSPDGCIDFAVNAAGQTCIGFVDSLSPDEIRQALEVNFLGHFYFLQEMLRRMQDGGAAVLLSSMAATHVLHGHVAYSCAKAAVNSLVQHAAIEYAPRGIRVNAVVPGLIDSPLARPALSVPGFREAFIKEIPLGRLVDAREIAAATLWLLDPAAYVTGALLPVDGGNHLRRPLYPDEMPSTAYDGL